MIILDERNFLRPALESAGLGIYDFSERPTVLDLAGFADLELARRGEMLLVDARSVLGHRGRGAAFAPVLNTFLGAIIFYDAGDDEARAWVEAEAPLLPKIIGAFALPMSAANWVLLANQLQFLWGLLEEQRKLQKHLARFSLELDQVLQSAEEEMLRAKHLHAALVPRRMEDVRGIQFQNRYAVGDGGGAEFFDLVKTPTAVYQILLSTRSYLISSAVLGILARHKEQAFDPEAFVAEVCAEAEAINGARKTRAEVDLLLLELDLAGQTLTVRTDSKAELRSLLKGPLETLRGRSVRLEKGEKVVVFSPGFLFNWKEAYPGRELATVVEGHQALPTGELLNELFIALKDVSGNGFLKRDATVAVMEVTRHGIHKV